MAYQQRRRPSGAGGGNSRGRKPFHGGGGRKGPKKENIHPSKFVKAARAVEEEKYESKHTFADFAVNPILAKNIADKKFIAPSPIQDQAIPAGLAGDDVIGIANTGTGKTVAFAVPVINRLLMQRNSRVLIMAPTRELASQILDEMKTLARRGDVYWTLLIGGAPMRFQLNDLKRNPRIVIGTPGRIKDHIERGSIDLAKFDTVVLDEVDRMLDMGFVKDMRTILAKLAPERQSFFFSATMDPKVRQLINEFSHDPVTISVKTGDTSDNVEQSVVQYASAEEKIEKLHDLLNESTDNKVLIFDETKRGVERLSKTLVARGFKTEAIHGDKSQGQRQRALDNFKKNKARIMIATDVAARGIDVADITHVVNYATPQSYSDYVHRIGRAGRAGRTGQAMTFVDKQSIVAASDPSRPSRSRQNARPARTHSRRPNRR